MSYDHVPRLRITDRDVYEALREIALSETLAGNCNVTIASVAVDILTGKRPALKVDKTR